MRVFVIGSLNCDYSVVCTRCPNDGETVIGNDFSVYAGGKGGNQAIAAARLGAETLFCGVVGGEDGGKRLVDILLSSGVDVSHIRFDSSASTGAAVIVISGGSNRIIVDPSANRCLRKSDVDSFLSGAKEGDILMTQLEISADIAGYAAQLGKMKGMTVCLNPAPADNAITDYLKYVDYLTPNQHELSMLGGKQRLFFHGVKTIITTLGSDGFEIATSLKSQTYPCRKAAAVDTTAAGDTFCGGLSAALSKGCSIEDACLFAAAAAALSVTRRGAAASVPTKEEVDKYIRKTEE